MARYIDADAFIEDIKTEAMNLFMDGLKGTPRPREELYYIIDRIESQPTADVVEARRGEWIGCWDHECSVCGKTFEYRTPHCPYCGAKMKNGSEDLI